MLSVELSPSNHELFQINSVNMSTTTNVLVGEWSHNMFTVISQLLKYYKSPQGILKKQQKINYDSSKNNDNDLSPAITKWCVLREDLEELDASFNFLDINLFLFNNSPSDPSVLLRMDSFCVKTLELYSGRMEDLVLEAHCNNFILLPFSVDHVIEVRI